MVAATSSLTKSLSKSSLDPSALTQTKVMNVGGSIRVNPLGLAIIVIMALGLLYFTFGSDSKSSPEGQMVSMKQLLAVGIEMAKRGGAEVKRIREQVRMSTNIIYRFY